jgi:hypothetical protein
MFTELKMSVGPAATAILLAVLSLNAAEESEALLTVTPKVKSIALFKNGLGFVLSSGEARPKEGWVRLDQLPAAALGTLWIGSADAAEPVREVIVYKQKLAELQEAITQSELLTANVGKRVVLTYNVAGSSKTVEGTLLAVPPDRKPDDPGLSSAAPPGYPGWRPSAERGEIILVQVRLNDRTTVLSVNKTAIQTVEIPEALNRQTSVEKEVTRAKIRLDGNPASAELAFAYLEKGLVWSPSYRVNIEDEQKAKLVLEAVVANDVEELENADISFVVGYPNFLYADVLSPLTSPQTVASFIQALSGDRRPNQRNPFANVMSQQQVIYNTANFDASSRPEGAYAVAPPTEGEGREDLYIYRKTGVTLKKGDRARYVLLNAAVPYNHLYQWEIGDTLNVDDRGYRIQDSNSRPQPENHVWHVVRLENTTAQPWTTAPAFTVNQAMPVAQDVLNYTPPGGKNTLKLTVATDLRAEQFQTETGRKPMSLEGRPFDEVTAAGKLKVTNWKAKPAHLLVRKSLVGEVLSADAESKVTKGSRRLTSVNPSSEIEWEFDLPSGKTKELGYQYKVLIYR